MKGINKAFIEHQLKPDNSQESKMLTQYLHLTHTSLIDEMASLKEENSQLKLELKELRFKRMQEQTSHKYAMEELRLSLEEKIKTMLKAKDSRNKMLADSLEDYEIELNKFALKCLDMEASVVTMKSENNELKRNVAIATDGLVEERRVLQIEKEQHQFEVDELQALMEEINKRLHEKEEELDEKNVRMKELEELLEHRNGDDGDSGRDGDNGEDIDPAHDGDNEDHDGEDDGYNGDGEGNCDSDDTSNDDDSERTEYIIKSSPNLEEYNIASLFDAAWVATLRKRRKLKTAQTRHHCVI